MGGPTWQSLSYAIWEQVAGIALMIGLIGIFRRNLNHQGHLAKSLSRSAYTVYIIHPPVIVGLALIIRHIEIYPLLKFILLAPVAVILCFLLAYPLRKLPFARNIL